ncbi:MAG: MBL fold metallo-hydrolase [Candidatus Omnitrophota bacterium]|jgi:metallo-beta-lactamase family protein
MSVKVKFLGGVRTVTGSTHLVSTDKSQVLIDCGLFHGHRDEAYQINTTFNYNPRKLKALVLSHAHIDHCGNIPNLINSGLRGKIFATRATKDLAQLMLVDSGKIQEEDTRYLNKINKRLGLAPRKPLYTRKEAERAIKRFHSLAYRKEFQVAKDISISLYDAGHILGSAIVVLDIKTVSRHIRLGYAVDLGRKNLPLLNDPDVPRRLDYLILESTYGGRFHAPIQEAKAKLKDVINRTISRKGKILIPSFSLERTQEVIFILDELIKEKSIPSIPIYVDSPLAIDITEVFCQNLDYFDAETRRAIQQGNNPFDSLNINYIRAQNDSKSLNNDKRPMIIIAGSGMCESGRILHHLKNNIEDSRNTVLVVGYMAQNTLGKRIVDKLRFVKIFGIEYELNAEVSVINAFSGHADQNELLDFVAQALPLKRIFLVHGDMEQTELLYAVLKQKGLNAYIPFKNEEILLD